MLVLGLNYYFGWREFPEQWYWYFILSLSVNLLGILLFTENISPVIAIINLLWIFPVTVLIYWHYEKNKDLPHTEGLFYATVGFLMIMFIATFVCLITEIFIKPKNVPAPS